MKKVGKVVKMLKSLSLGLVHCELLGAHEDNWKACQNDEEQKLGDVHFELLRVHEESWKSHQSLEEQKL